MEKFRDKSTRISTGWATLIGKNGHNIAMTTEQTTQDQSYH